MSRPVSQLTLMKLSSNRKAIDTLNPITIQIDDVQESQDELEDDGVPLLGRESLRVNHALTKIPQQTLPRLEQSRPFVQCIPAVLLGVVLNLLDALSYGIIIFPASASYIPETATQAGISMFLLSTIIAQLTYSFGGSGFRGAVGSMMIEVMPFLHIMCQVIQNSVGENVQSILPTIMFTYALSSVFTGLVFLVLGKFRLGNVIQFFPRHILIGCIGGIGLFLLMTGVEVTARIKPQASLEFIKLLFEPWNLKLWLSSLTVAMLLKCLQKFIHWPLLVPVFYTVLPLAFYVFMFTLKFTMDDLRDGGWLFDLPKGAQAPFYLFWTFYDFSKIDFLACINCFPTILALTFFGILHVPINVPALAVSTMQDVQINDELTGHGISNLLSGFAGTCQNYLVYSNSVLYFRSGGDSIASGILLAGLTAVLWVLGSSVAGLVPVLVVGALIFHLGFDLVKESVFDTWNVGMLPLEYFTVVLIVVVMGVFGFTEGILTGVVLACIFFGKLCLLCNILVYTVSQKSVIRASFSGKSMKSCVNRIARQQRFLDSVGDQIHVLQLQGFMFFGTVNQLDDYINQLLHDSVRVKYIIMDFKLIHGIDYSATEAFHRLKKLMKPSKCKLIFCCLTEAIQDVLHQAGIFAKNMQDSTSLHESSLTEQQAADEMELIQEAEDTRDYAVLMFDSLSAALEYCENDMLSMFYEFPNPSFAVAKHLDYTHLQSPRTNQLITAAKQTILQPHLSNSHPEPNSNFITQLLNECCTNLTLNEIQVISSWFECLSVDKNQVLWDIDDEPKEILIVESGELELMRESGIEFKLSETFLGGSMLGQELFFAEQPRKHRLVAKEDSLVWRFTRQEFDKQKINGDLIVKFITAALRFSPSKNNNILF